MTICSDLAEKIPINFFSGPQKPNLPSTSLIMCAHLGSLVWDGFNNLEYKKKPESLIGQRIFNCL